MNIVITGASRGIGFELVKNFYAEGHTVFAISRNKKTLERFKDKSKTGGEIIFLDMDLSKEDEFLKLEMVFKRVDSIEVLINNAGMLINKPFEEITFSDWRIIYQTNVFAVAELCKRLLPLLKNGKLDEKVKSHIVNVSSIGGVQGSVKFPGLSAYSSSKGALNVLTECMSLEFQSHQVVVNGLGLGSVQTEMFSAAFPGMKGSFDPAELSNYIFDFCLNGYRFFNGKILQLSNSTP